MNKEKLNLIVDKYSKNFEQNWKEEKNKWEEIKYFQAHYKESIICDPCEYAWKLKDLFKKSESITTSNHYFPLRDIFLIAEKEPIGIRNAIQKLLEGADAYYEDDDGSTINKSKMEECIKEYQRTVKSLKEKFVGAYPNDGYDLRFVSTLLFYAYPEKFSIYKYDNLKKFSEEYEIGIKFNIGKPECLFRSNDLISIIAEYIIVEKGHSQSPVKKMLDQYEKFRSPDHYSDPSYRVLAQNILWYATSHQSKDSTVSKKTIVKPKNTVCEKGKPFSSTYRPTVRTAKGAKKDASDYIKEAQEKAKEGKLGENFVMEYENERLAEWNRPEKTEWVSENEGDGYGYDILSYDEFGNKKYIEVKSTNGPADTAFYITAVELAASEKYGEQYYLYRVYKENGERKIVYYRGAEIKQLCNAPALYIVTKG